MHSIVCMSRGIYYRPWKECIVSVVCPLNKIISSCVYVLWVLCPRITCPAQLRSILTATCHPAAHHQLWRVWQQCSHHSCHIWDGWGIVVVMDEWEVHSHWCCDLCVSCYSPIKKQVASNRGKGRRRQHLSPVWRIRYCLPLVCWGSNGPRSGADRLGCMCMVFLLLM